jgi:hypothetical protein
MPKHREWHIARFVFGTFAVTITIHTVSQSCEKLHNLFVIKDTSFFFFLDDCYASTAYSENIAVYIQGFPIL